MAITLEYDGLHNQRPCWKLGLPLAINQVTINAISGDVSDCFDTFRFNSPDLQPALTGAITCIRKCWDNVSCLVPCALDNTASPVQVGVIIQWMLSHPCADNPCCPDPEQIYTGTLTVLQKDAYSNVAGRSSDAWPPHTTTVFQWDFGKEVQVNHGTAPEEVDASGKHFLVKTKVYTFTGTREQLEALQAAYRKAVYDDTSHKFLSLTNGTGVLEKAFITGLKDYLADDANGLVCTGSVTKEELIALLAAGDFHGFGVALPKCNWEASDWEVAVETVLNDVMTELGEDIREYHVCNNDADLQVRLIKNYLETGRIELPAKENNGPMMYYTPN